MNEWWIKKVHSIAKHEGMPKGLKTKDRNETVHFDLHWTAGIDCHYDNEFSSRENGEGIEEDSDYEPESGSDSKSDENWTDDDDE